MAKAKNSSSAPPPLPPDTPPARGRCIPPANTEPARPSWETEQALSQAEFSFQEAERHCWAAISKGEKAVDQRQWALKSARLSKILQPRLKAAVAKCEQVGMHADKLEEARTRIKELDTYWDHVCEYWNSPAPAPAAKAASVDPIKTGAPGRPTAMHIIIAEAERRIANSEVTPKLGDLAQFSRDLETWWKEKRHEYGSGLPVPTARTIEQKVRPLWHRALSSAQNRRTKL